MSEGHTRESTRLGVVRLLSEVSGLPLEKINDNDNLHSLGLDSLDIADLDLCFEKKYGFNLEDLYDSIPQGSLPDPAVFMPIEATVNVRQIVDYVHKRAYEEIPARA